MNDRTVPAVWFPAIRTGTGTDVFTRQLADGLAACGVRVGVTWLPLRAEYAAWTCRRPQAPSWASVAHVNTWLPRCFLPPHLPVVATLHHAVHDPALRPYKGAIRAAYHRYWIAPNERRLMGRADRVVAVSRSVAASARAELLDVPMEVVYNGVDTALYRPGNRRRDGVFRLLYVGSWSARKGVDLLAPVMRRLGAGFQLLYTGPQAGTEDGNMHDIGRLYGDQAVVAAMRDADALLFPSRSEGFSLVVLEAMACGLPVVAARIPALQEVIEHGTSGWLCPPGDVDAFAAAVREMAADHALYTQMRHAARARVEADYARDRCVRRYLEVYRQLLAKRG